MQERKGKMSCIEGPRASAFPIRDLAEDIMALVSNSYLDETSAKIRSKPVPWEVCRTPIWTAQRLILK